ncbi:Calcium/calmodulin-dependent protein kinase [Lachnellula hyalina]|uniref:Calcium/calmodulin-dependent protein kinase n=1 Tax=Lachnellula hyalina TaxID=1316788 RepID=A0A8H8QTQ6_9HELO|nr:Calcium/calmodulin-dependent protein kinase [Lachnellula hyalina]TVY22366.1 Calcium/calmodulin-dependent protein kinase [Lachnellula hyalina]
MAASIKIGQRLEGKVGSYFVSAQVARDTWTATKSNSQAGKVIIKTAPQGRLENERDILKNFRNCLYIRQALHDDGYTHTDIKPDNILVNYGTGSSRFSDVQLADFGDIFRIDPKDYLKVGMDGPHMGAAIFRSPEAMVQLRWGQSTDNWSFGATLISLIWGLNWHMFKPDPKDATADDEEEDGYRWGVLASATQYIKDNQKQRPFKIIEDDCLTEEDRTFLLKVMKLDPRDRPTARELLQDDWFSGVL